jgi:hypothetical protein
MASDRKLSLELELQPAAPCKKCGQPEGEHAHIGDFCPAPSLESLDKFGPIWLTTHYEPLEDA